MDTASFGHRFMRHLVGIGILSQLRIVVAFGFNGTCEHTKGATVVAYTHWPFEVNCEHLQREWKVRSVANETDSFECFVYHNGSKYSENLFELTELTEDDLFKTELIINNSVCLSSNVTVDLRPFPNESCVASAGKNLHQKSNTINKHVTLICKPLEGSPDIIPKAANRQNFRTRWLTTCDMNTEYRFHNGWKNVPPPVDTYPDSLNMHHVDFWDATNFTCAVTYKSMILYVVTYEQCIKQQPDKRAPSVTCTKWKQVARGENAKFDCDGHMAIGETKSDDMKIYWKKNGNVICENRLFDRKVDGTDKRLSCIAHDETNNASLKCINNVTDSTPDASIQLERKEIKMTLSISNVKSEDFSDAYSIEFKVRNEKKWQNATQAMTLDENRTPTLKMTIVILASFLAVMLTMLLVAIVVYRKRIYFLLWCKRLRTKYDKDDKRYAAYISYLYNGSSNSKSDQATKKIVFAIQRVMEELDYKYYDEQREGNFDAVVEIIINLVENSHRMIIVLTEEYLDDKLRRFHAELGFHELLESRTRLIFILTPGVKKALVNRATTDKVWEKLLIALNSEGQSIINWKENMSRDELMRHIEYALPMLDRKEHELSMLSGSGRKATLNGVVYHRSISQTPLCTEV